MQKNFWNRSKEFFSSDANALWLLTKQRQSCTFIYFIIAILVMGNLPMHFLFGSKSWFSILIGWENFFLILALHKFNDSLDLSEPQ